VSASALPATAGAVAALSAEVAAMQAMIRGLRAEIALRLDVDGAGGGTAADRTCAAAGDGRCESVTLPLSIRVPGGPEVLSRVVNLPVTVPPLGPAGGGNAPWMLRAALSATIEEADATVRLSAKDVERLYDTLLQMYIERLLPPPRRPHSGGSGRATGSPSPPLPTRTPQLAWAAAPAEASVQDGDEPR
jgi:hypothetical protein